MESRIDADVREYGPSIWTARWGSFYGSIFEDGMFCLVLEWAGGGIGDWCFC